MISDPASNPAPLGSPSRAVFAYGSSRVGVASADASHLAWLEEFLTPQFECSPTGSADVEIALRCESDAYAELESQGAGSEEIDVFALDSRVVRLPFRESKHRLVAFDEEQHVFYQVNRDRTAIEILAAENSLQPRLPLMKSVRELAMGSIRDPSSLLLHAAAFEHEGQGVLIGGPKRAGKTSLLIYALETLRSSYVTNDRAWISLASEPHVHGLPTIVTIRDTAFELFPDLLTAIQNERFHHRLSLAEARAEAKDESAPMPRPSKDGRYGVTPAQFCRLVKTRPIASCPARTILFPNRGEQPGPLKLRRLSVEQASRRLAECLFGAGTSPGPERLFSIPGSQPASTRGVRGDLCQRLARQLRCFDCRLGPQSYTHPRSAEALLRELP